MSEAASAGMMAEPAFRVIFRDQLLHSNGILSRLSGGWSSCLAGQSSFGYWEQLPKPRSRRIFGLSAGGNTRRYTL